MLCVWPKTPLPEGDFAFSNNQGIALASGPSSRLDLSLYFALVIRLPGWTGIVFADLPSGTIDLHTWGLRLER
jgi:hypothetical protein